MNNLTTNTDNEVFNEEISSPKSDHFSEETNTNNDIEKDYDFGSAGSSSRRESDEDSWETVSEEMRAEAMEHQAEGHCLCNICSMKSISISTRIMNRSAFRSEPLPDNVSKVVTAEGADIYIIGTAHFSQSSQDDVEKAIQHLSPDVVMVELCSSRIGVLKYDEESLLKAAQDVSIAKLKMAIKESGSVISGLMQLLLLSMSAHITKQLGMAPGGEFRVAAKQARKIPGCRLVLGDRPIQATLGRAMASLSFYQKLKLGWHLVFSKDDITKEDVEKYKQKDMIAEMLAEMTGDFPELSRVFVEERDQYMAQMLWHCTEVVKNDLPACIILNEEDAENKKEDSKTENEETQNVDEAQQKSDVENLDQSQQVSDVEKVDQTQKISDVENVDQTQPISDVENIDLSRQISDVVDEIGSKTISEENEQREERISRSDYKPVIVGVVGIGHMNGIIANIGKPCDMNELNKVPEATYANKALKMTIKAAFVAALSWGVYSIIRWVRS